MKKKIRYLSGGVLVPQKPHSEYPSFLSSKPSAIPLTESEKLLDRIKHAKVLADDIRKIAELIIHLYVKTQK